MQKKDQKPQNKIPKKKTIPKPENKLTKDEIDSMRINNEQVAELKKKHPHMNENSLKNLIVWHKNYHPKGAGRPKGAKSFVHQMQKLLNDGEITKEFLCHVVLQQAAEGNLMALDRVRAWAGEEKMVIDLKADMEVSTKDKVEFDSLSPAVQQKVLKKLQDKLDKKVD